METTNGKGSKAVSSPKKVEAAAIIPPAATILNGDQSEKETALGGSENQDLTLKQEETLSGGMTEKSESIVALEAILTQGSEVLSSIGPLLNGIEVISRRDGFRRAGLIFSKEATRIKFCDITEQQYLALQAEPMFSIKRITI
jgi:hypothetical protein